MGPIQTAYSCPFEKEVQCYIFAALYHNIDNEQN